MHSTLLFSAFVPLQELGYQQNELQIHRNGMGKQDYRYFVLRADRWVAYVASVAHVA